MFRWVKRLRIWYITAMLSVCGIPTYTITSRQLLSTLYDKLYRRYGEIIGLLHFILFHSNNYKLNICIRYTSSFKLIFVRTLFSWASPIWTNFNGCSSKIPQMQCTAKQCLWSKEFTASNHLSKLCTNTK